MQIKYYFHPHMHWNVITKEVYDILKLHYGEDKLKQEEVNE